MVKDEVYVSMEQPQYRKSKADILGCQAGFLKTLKHIHNLRVYARRKNDLKIELKNDLNVLLTHLELIQAKMPIPKVPKLKKKREIVVKEVISHSPEIERRNEVETELKMIQEKLKSLNG
ncbi:hypothetical protein HN604_01175 [archaeon]|mgnify:FL=1|jgi:hypothetical protein|nr:hypothetical protein [archaeon]MBT6182918.1 hypothetical protein [archaeon]MBT6606771.1 hypothetical protein [archaeon]MBT7251756.1 hypothetical protein [archaeon]MBT7660675.1 hypothetical protein [archaeon]